MKNPKVEFAGYSVPHPSEHKINLRIQTYDTPCLQVLHSHWQIVDIRRALVNFTFLIVSFQGGVQPQKNPNPKWGFHSNVGLCGVEHPLFSFSTAQNDLPLLQVTRKALSDISDVCDHVLDTIDAAIDDFNIENEDISDK